MYNRGAQLVSCYGHGKRGHPELSLANLFYSFISSTHSKYNLILLMICIPKDTSFSQNIKCVQPTECNESFLTYYNIVKRLLDRSHQACSHRF